MVSYNIIMQVSKYINIPKIQSTITNSHKYLGYSEVLISLLTGLLLICFNTINQYTATQSELQIIYLFSAILIAKAVIPINYFFRSRRITHKSRLQQQARVTVRGLFIPAFIKSLLYFGLMMLTLYVSWVIFVIPPIFCILAVQLLDYFIKKKNRYLMTLATNNHKGSSIRISPQQHRPKKASRSACINFKQVVIQILLVLALLFHVENYQFNYNLQSVVLICLIGSLCLLAFYYMHNQIFQLYCSEVDEVLAHQYPIQLFNFVLYCLIYSLSASPNSTASQNVASFNSTVENANNINKNQSNYSSPHFLFMLQFPVHSLVGVFLSILYEYMCFQMIKKSSVKYLFLTQLTGIFWVNIYLFKYGITTSRYFSAIFSFCALFLLCRLVSIEQAYNRMVKIARWTRKKMIRFKQGKDKRTNMIQQN